MTHPGAAAPQRVRHEVLTAQRFVAGAADAIENTLRDAIDQRGSATFALAGGSTPLAIYRELARRARTGETPLPWHRAELYWGDERCVPPDHADSNYRRARETLLDGLPVAPAGVHRIAGEAEPAAAAAQYEALLVRRFGSDLDAPTFDLALLGLGADGHTASLFPNSPALALRDRRVAAQWIASLDAWRITLTLPALAAARRVLFAVAGADKSAAVRSVLASASERSQFAGTPLAEPPARRVSEAALDVLWLLDEAAARDISSEMGAQ